MRKFFKIFTISFLSLLALLALGVSITMWVVLTPKKLTPIVRKQAAKMITCQTNIGEIKSTFFSTFPNFGLRINHLTLINPVPGSDNDTLLNVEEFTALIDINAFMQKRKMIVTDLVLKNGNLNIFNDSIGNSNYMVFLLDSAVAEDEIETNNNNGIDFINLEGVKFDNINLSYVDHAHKIQSKISDLAATLSATMDKDSVSGHVQIEKSDVSFAYEGNQYLKNADVMLDVPAEIVLSKQRVFLSNAVASVNKIAISLDGVIENDTLAGNIITNVNYHFANWSLKEVMDLLEPFKLAEGLKMGGLLTSTGTIEGIYNESSLPAYRGNMQLSDGEVIYKELPLPLSAINSEIDLSIDFQDDSKAKVRIKKLEMRTPKSELQLEGTVKKLLTSRHFQLDGSGNIQLDELNGFIPAKFKTNLKGKLNTSVKADFSMAQIEQNQLDKVSISGTAIANNLNIVYDTITIDADQAAIDFSLPNYKKNKKASFAYVNFKSDEFNATQLNGVVSYLKNAAIEVEMSDVMDTTAIPHANVVFKIDSLATKMDTIQLAVKKPVGNFQYTSSATNPALPQIKLQYQSENLSTNVGKSGFLLKKIKMDADILNDESKEDFFQQWMINGFLDMEEGQINLAALTHSIELPSIKMDFSPERFNITESQLKINNSDFQLNGTLNNILSYFRGDSLLLGNFKFASSNTDITQLMNMTNGFGSDTEVGLNEEVSQDKESGPYIVPKGIDVVLNTEIKQATYGIDTMSNLSGNIRVKDGILLLDDYSLATTAAKIHLTAIYRTPRKNHLFLGLDYHMLEVEIEQLLKTIPDIDSLMPMLRSFSGKGEFHMTVETYLDSAYNMKMSTLRGASSIRGQNLVLMDGETFGEIAKKLMFNRKTENRVDSLAAEFTIFRNEIDIYPFLLVMDKYKAVVAGRHNFDLSFDYHISVVDCPLPLKLGIDVTGTIDDLDYKLTKCRYKDIYRPARRKVVENKQLELRNMIRETLVKKLEEKQTE